MRGVRGKGTGHALSLPEDTYRSLPAQMLSLLSVHQLPVPRCQHALTCLLVLILQDMCWYDTPPTKPFIASEMRKVQLFTPCLSLPSYFWSLTHITSTL